jgi:hypothetical protein
MNVKEYIVAKYKSEKAGIILKKEAVIFGIPYPLASGWMDDYGHIVLTRKMILRLRAYLQISHKENTHSLNALTILGGRLTVEESLALEHLLAY